jgi:hypothetical protein
LLAASPDVSSLIVYLVIMLALSASVHAHAVA